MNFSYSTIADVYASQDDVEDKKALLEFAEELEQVGVASYEGVEYMYRDTQYGLEVVSMQDYESEQEG